MAFSAALFSVAVTLRQEGASFVLRYTDVARAREAYSLLKLRAGNVAASAAELVVQARDDFGTEVSVDRRDIMLVLHEDLARALEVNGTVGPIFGASFTSRCRKPPAISVHLGASGPN